jgi:hypothetical protein
MGSTPNSEKICFFMIRCEKFRSMEKDKIPRPSISLDPELYELARLRMEQRRVKMFSRYIQDLIKEDTASLIPPAQAIAFPEQLSKVAEEPPPYGKASGNDPVPLVRHSKVSYSTKKIKRK